ncbi:unnamed protein product [Blepharisma stoltei]|uniref:Uncharacterized protein n=1 Tax=Blepharisma stoltei TaxID=1481888 RepID=A0AAU9JHW3_9CILI|nr:unnamed protein product [Blepharisma stoltei]
MNKVVKIGTFSLLLLWIFIITILIEFPEESEPEAIVNLNLVPDIGILIESPIVETEHQKAEISRNSQLNMRDDEISINPLNLACKPESFGYSEEEAFLLFPNKQYPQCEERYKSTQEMFYIDRKNDTLYMNCTGRVVLGQLEVREQLGKYVFNNRIKEYWGPVQLETQEYAFGTCDLNKRTDFEHVTYKLRPKEESLKRAKNSLVGKPINIVMLVIDSLSRRSFFRKLPMCLDYLNSNAKNFSIFDFKLHHIMGQNSPASYMPTFFGDMPFKQSRKIFRGDLYYSISIWKYLHDRGFVTMIGMDNCGDNLPSYIGRTPNVDHIMGSFWCAAKAYYGYSQSLKKERCIGNKNAHTWMLDLILDFSDTYKNVSKYTYMHVNTAHEETGTVISTLDLDLKNFLQDFTSRDEDYVLFLMGDHGMRYGSWFKSKDGSHEHKLPLLLTIVKNSVLENAPNSTEALLHNSNRLISKLDFHTTLQHLGNYPDMESGIFDIRQKTSKTKKTYNLFYDHIPDNRTCEDAGIPVYWCGCKPFEEITENTQDFDYLANNIIDTFNHENKIDDSSKETICQKLNLNKTSYIGKQEDSDISYWKIKFSIQEKASALFEVIIRLSKTQITKRESEYFNVRNITFGEMKYYNIMNVNRLDAYDSVCKDEILKKGFDPVYCICNESDFTIPALNTTQTEDSERL